MIANREDHHRHEAEQIHVNVGRPVHDELWPDRNRNTEQDSAAEPRETRLHEPFDKRAHAVTGVSR